MQFEKGHKLAKGGKRIGAGRKPKAVAERREAEREAGKMVARIAADMAREYLERWLRPALDAFRYAATGTHGFQFDAATNRDFIRKFVPDAAKFLTLDVQHSAELFFAEIMAEEAEGVKEIEDQSAEEEALPGAARPVDG